MSNNVQYCILCIFLKGTKKLKLIFFPFLLSLMHIESNVIVRKSFKILSLPWSYKSVFEEHF